MKSIELAAVQERFADIVWENEPIASGDLVKVCEKELSWKKPTTYTVLRKLCEKGLLQNVDGVVTSLISREEFYSAKSEQIVEDSYEGSLPAFIAAYNTMGLMVSVNIIDSLSTDLRTERLYFNSSIILAILNLLIGA